MAGKTVKFPVRVTPFRCFTSPQNPTRVQTPLLFKQNMTKDKFHIWLTKLKISGKSNEEISKILDGVAKYSSIAIYEAIMLTLSEKDMNEIEQIESETEAMKRIEEKLEKRHRMKLNEFVGQIQKYLLDY